MALGQRATCARVSRTRVRTSLEPVGPTKAERTKALQDAASQQGRDARGKTPATGSSVFSSSHAIARGPHVPLTGSPTIPDESPMMLPPPPVDVLPVFEVTRNPPPDELAAAIDVLLTTTLASAGAVLLRNLPFRSAGELKRLLQRCSEAGDPANWIHMPTHPFGRDRPKLEGMEMISKNNVGAGKLLECHNELSFNPRYPRRFLLACLQDVLEGGETLMARNADLTEVIPAELQAFVRDHGGVRYTRRYHDATANGKKGIMPWQEKCGLIEGQGREDAEKYFLDIGFQPSDITWEEDGTMVVSNVNTGFHIGKHSGKEEWFYHELVDRLFKGPDVITAADGERFPEGLMQEADRRKWECVYVFKLRPRDLLVLDNLRVQHGRLPYMDGDEPRCMIIELCE